MSNVSQDLGKIPGASELRGRIEAVRKKGSRNALKFAWLGLCRASEVVGKASKSDTGTTPRGPMGCELDLTEYVEKENLPALTTNMIDDDDDSRMLGKFVEGSVPKTAADLYKTIITFALGAFFMYFIVKQNYL